MSKSRLDDFLDGLERGDLTVATTIHEMRSPFRDEFVKPKTGWLTEREQPAPEKFKACSFKDDPFQLLVDEKYFDDLVNEKEEEAKAIERALESKPVIKGIMDEEVPASKIKLIYKLDGRREFHDEDLIIYEQDNDFKMYEKDFFQDQSQFEVVSEFKQQLLKTENERIDKAIDSGPFESGNVIYVNEENCRRALVNDANKKQLLIGQVTTSERYQELTALPKTFSINSITESLYALPYVYSVQVEYKSNYILNVEIEFSAQIFFDNFVRLQIKPLREKQSPLGLSWHLHLSDSDGDIYEEII